MRPAPVPRPPLPGLTPSLSPPRPLCSSHVDLLAVCPTCQAQACLRAFTPAVTAAWSTPCPESPTVKFNGLPATRSQLRRHLPSKGLPRPPYLKLQTTPTLHGPFRLCHFSTAHAPSDTPRDTRSGVCPWPLPLHAGGGLPCLAHCRVLSRACTRHLVNASRMKEHHGAGDVLLHTPPRF